MSEQSSVREELEKHLVEEHIRQADLQRKQLNRFLIAILALILPTMSGAVAILLTSAKGTISYNELLKIAVSVLSIIGAELSIGTLFRAKPHKRQDLKWTIGEMYVRLLEESALNPEVEPVQKNDAAP